jgi:peptidoglycan/LPS O-acetylase OafA/YrhL
VAPVAILSVLHLARVPDYVIHEPHQSLPGAVGSAFGLYLNWYEGHRGYLPAGWDVLWSLSIEEVFYLGFPLVCLLLRKDWALSLPLAVIMLSQPWRLKSIVGNPIWREKAYLPGMAGIAAGVLTAIVAAHLAQNTRGLRIALMTAGACGVFAILGFEDNLTPWIGFGVILVLTISTASLVLGFHLQAKAAPGWRLRGTGWMQSCGRLSYEIYLTHMFVVLTLVRIFRKSHAGIAWGFFWYFPAIALAWAVGWIVSKYFSIPCERALREKLLRPGQRKAAETFGD